eukprot:839544-Pelagomonas_calceolata.AAC.3
MHRHLPECDHLQSCCTTPTAFAGMHGDEQAAPCLQGLVITTLIAFYYRTPAQQPCCTISTAFADMHRDGQAAPCLQGPVITTLIAFYYTSHLLNSPAAPHLRLLPTYTEMGSTSHAGIGTLVLVHPSAGAP